MCFKTGLAVVRCATLRGCFVRAGVTLLAVAMAAGCRGTGYRASAPRDRQDVGRPAPPCPAEAPALPQLPFERPVHALVDFWIATTSTDSGHAELLLDGTQVAEHDRRIERLTHEGWPAGRWDLLERPLVPRRIEQRLELQLQRLRLAVARNERVLADGRPPTELLAQLQRTIDSSHPADELRVAWRSTPLRCYPTDRAVHDGPWQLAFDQFQCSQLRYGEAVRVLRKTARYWLVWSSYGEGWVSPGALTPPLTGAEARRYLRPQRYVIVDRDRLPVFFDSSGDGAGGQLGEELAVARLGLRLPLFSEAGAAAKQSGSPATAPGRLGDRTRPASTAPERVEVIAPRRTGLFRGRLPAGYQAQRGPAPLTRQRLWRLAFSLLDTPYGWGGTGGHRDCSRLLMDLFAVFGLHLPRNSWMQGQSGVRTVEVGELGEADKRAAIEEAGARDVLLLYLPGHIMLYLGRDGDHLYALHLFSGYLTPCAGGRGETMNRVNRTTVTSLELGRGSSRRAFIERITRLVIFGPPGPAPRPADN